MGINFPASPIVGQKYPQPAVAGIPVYTWDGEKWTTVGGSIAAYAPPADAVPLMDATPGLVGTTTEYAREDHVHPTDTTRASAVSVQEAFGSAMAYSGMQINGGMEISQERGTSPATLNGYICDGWGQAFGGSMALTGIGGPLSNVIPGFGGLLYIQTPTVQPSLSAGDYAYVFHRIEGWRTARLAWGTASAQSLTISFWTAHTRTGIYSATIRNDSATRSYAFTYTQAASGVAQYNTVTVPGCTDAVWLVDNAAGIHLAFALGMGSTFVAPSANTWLSGNYLAAPGQVNAVAATSDVFRITGVTVLPGTQAPTAAQSPNIMRPYGEELVMCQRYLEAITVGAGGTCCMSSLWAGTTNVFYASFHASKRAVPTVSLGAGSAWAVASPTLVSQTVDGILFTHGTSHFYIGGTPNGNGLILDARL